VNSQLAAAYGVCRGITRTAAKNFYYGFLVLPRRKRDALSAVYAFMRHADDICDNPALPDGVKREKLTELLDALRRVMAGEATDDPVLLALADAQKRFKIRPELLEQLVHGTSMDLSGCSPYFAPRSPAADMSVSGEAATAVAPAVRYRTFDELYEYCYYVASVVGLICIRIFGYRDLNAEPLAEHVGVAFQLTNIIRDVKEDANMGRVYLPEEDLARFGLTAADLRGGADPARLRPVLEIEAKRARDFYKAADELLPLVDDDSQPALWALVQIYRTLLEKIARRNYDVLTARVRLSVPEKLAILSKGFLRGLI
jgi:phytoene synthase